MKLYAPANCRLHAAFLDSLRAYSFHYVPLSPFIDFTTTIPIRFDHNTAA